MSVYRDSKNVKMWRCDCGSEVQFVSRKPHMKSQKHISFINKDQPTPIEIKSKIPLITNDNISNITLFYYEGSVKRLICECGSDIVDVSQYTHDRSKKHIAFINGDHICECGGDLRKGCGMFHTQHDAWEKAWERSINQAIDEYQLII